MIATRTTWHSPRYGRPDILTALRLQRTAALTGGDRVELWGNSRAAGGYFLAGQSSFRRAKIG